MHFRHLKECRKFRLGECRVRKSKNFPDSKIFVAKTFRIKCVNRVNFQNIAKGTMDPRVEFCLPK